MPVSGPMPIIEIAPVTEIAHAKLNLTLRILGRRADGYHELDGIVAFAEFGDRLTISAALAHPRLEVSGPYRSEISGVNLVSTALARIENAAGTPLPIDIHLEKNLPVASGIGGGSADAAALLRAVRRSRPDLAHLDWPAIALSIGADCPVCLISRTSAMAGIGEVLAPLDLPSFPIVLANPMLPMPADKTRQVFQALAAPPFDARTRHRETPPATLDRASLIERIAAIGNDLERPATAVFPGILPLKRALAAKPGCLATSLSGAGPTVFGIFDDEVSAESAASALQGEGHGWWARATRTL